MKTGIIDFGEIDSNAIETIHNTIANAILAEERGFSRYWLTEHHVNGVAWRNPELIISLIAASTETIKVGAAGVIATVNQPYRIAQDYKLLSNLFPDRIDLGFAKGGMNTEIHQVIAGKNLPDFFEQINKTRSFLDNQVEQLPLSPVSSVVPSLWMLGSSTHSVNFAIQGKMNFSLSLFHNLASALPSPSIIIEFKREFMNQHGFMPQVNIAASVFCHEDENRIAEEVQTRKNVTLNVYGNAEACRAQLKRLSQLYEVDEVVILNLGRDHAEKQLLLKKLLATTQILH